MSEQQQTHRHTNRLIHETSPYLLQHAHNPVDWYPWGEEALRKASEEDKPVLLSVGYSACHWCHVMERESFENEQIADLMNQHFVSVKVDREERPDIDGIYMQAVQAMTQHGGWPMTVFLLPDGRPFYGGTYFPPFDRNYGQSRMPGFQTILHNIIRVFSEHRSEIEEQATQLTEYLKQYSNAPLQKETPGTIPPLAMLAHAGHILAKQFDDVEGGFGQAPKFPNTMALEFLLRLHLHRSNGMISSPLEAGEPSELAMVELTLQRMAHGGIYDQLGGGFHRYSVDEHWLAPHFEKMLYDNALLSRLYLHTYQVTNNPFYRRIVEETLDYVIREMTSPEGGFYSTQDADSEGEEGKFFLWTPGEVRTAQTTHPELSPDDMILFQRYYDVTEEGNFEGKNILHISRPASEIATEASISEHALLESLQRTCAVLFSLREQRIKPGRDEKILTSWNGLMLRSFAEAARILKRDDYLQVARQNANFLLQHLQRDGRLLRTYKDGRARLNGYLEDYAFLADGLLSLYEATFEIQWFIEARNLMDQALTLFADKENGGLFDTGSDHETLINRPRDIMDNATPAGNSVATEVFLRLAAFTGVDRYREHADRYLNALADSALQHPQAFGHLLGALDFAIGGSHEIAIIGHLGAEDTQQLLAVINSQYYPNSVLASASADDKQAATVIPLLADRPVRDGKATAYVCQHFACQEPVTSPSVLAHLL